MPKRDADYRQIRADLKPHSLANLERLGCEVGNPKIRRAIVDEARERLTGQADAASDVT